MDSYLRQVEDILFKQGGQTEYTNVVVKLGNGKVMHDTIVSKMITSDGMAVYIGLQKLFKSYYASRIMTITMPHSPSIRLGQVVRFSIGDIDLDTYWQVTGKTTTISFQSFLRDNITLENKRCYR